MGRGYSGNHPRFSHRQDERYDAKEAYNKDLTASARLHYLENDRHDHESPAKKHCSPMHNVGLTMDAVRRARRTANEVADYAADPYGFETNPRFERRLPGFAENTTAPGGLDYENMQARANHADWRNKMGYDATLQKEYVDDMKNYLEMDTPDTGLDNSMFVKESPMNRHTRSHKLRERAIKISERSGAERGDEYDYENPKVQKLLEKANSLDERSNNKAVKKFYKQTGYDVKNMDFSNATSGNANMTRHVRPLPKKKVDDERSGEIRNQMIDEMIDDRPDSPMNACAKSEGGSGCIKQMGGAWRVISNKTDKPWPAKYANKAKAEAALRGYHAG